MSEAKRPAITLEERERLRALADGSPTLILTGAPLAALLDENEAMRRALGPLAALHLSETEMLGTHRRPIYQRDETVLTVADVLRARAALAGSDLVKGAP